MYKNIWQTKESESQSTLQINQILNSSDRYLGVFTRLKKNRCKAKMQYLFTLQV